MVMTHERIVNECMFYIILQLPFWAEYSPHECTAVHEQICHVCMQPAW